MARDSNPTPYDNSSIEGENSRAQDSVRTAARQIANTKGWSSSSSSFSITSISSTVSFCSSSASSSSSSRRKARKENRRTRRLGANQSYCTMFTSSNASSDHDRSAHARTRDRFPLYAPPRNSLPSPFMSLHLSFDRSPHPSTRPSANRRRRPRISRRPSAVSTWRLPAWFSDHGRARSRVQFATMLAAERDGRKGGGRDGREMTQGRS